MNELGVFVGAAAEAAELARLERAIRARLPQVTHEKLIVGLRSLVKSLARVEGRSLREVLDEHLPDPTDEALMAFRAAVTRFRTD